MGCAEELVMNSYKPVLLSALSAALLGPLLGCATVRACTSDACVADAAISSQVEAAMAQHPALEAPNSVRVQTADGIVYLHGQVSTGLQREEAEELARQVPKVRQVVDSLRTTNSGS
jgi:osmotically-inducible protein OsmY